MTDPHLIFDIFVILIGALGVAWWVIGAPRH